MSSYLSKILTITMCLLGGALTLYAQNESGEEVYTDSSDVAQDTTLIEEEPWPLNKKGEPKGSQFFVLSAMRLGTDLRPLVQSMTESKMSAYTLYADFMIRNAFFITGEYGVMDRTKENPDADFFRYRSNGSFYRFGIEYNVMKRASTANALSFGLKYANSTFDQSADFYSSGNDYWEEGATLKHLTEKNVNVDWYEFTVSLKLVLVQNLTVDFGFAYTIKKDFPPTAITKAHIPGWYHNKDDRSRLNFQYRLLYRIPFWPMYTEPRQKKKQ
ncbi:DUF6048 family protein [Flammeovirga aprica]|uniref:DUF481 domain-containing protein n=1 Tax=Flammeovirga aprica JL-4 TaxID=694437 RepID=A0A7X9RSW7_9BACT|nr:DUF6048 family protein [Flammeovirga aprica]NME67621.1 hypothetical protein [Flammeovirga aprica JL-4]